MGDSYIIGCYIILKLYNFIWALLFLCKSLWNFIRIVLVKSMGLKQQCASSNMYLIMQ